MPLLSTKELVELLFNAVCLVVLLFLLPYHSNRIYLDLFKDERKSLSHRRDLPTKDNMYRTTAYLMAGTLFAYIIQLSSTIVSYFMSDRTAWSLVAV